nr:MAG TPA: hypothetical protein [Caudoviricetes sp.]
MPFCVFCDSINISVVARPPIYFVSCSAYLLSRAFIFSFASSRSLHCSNSNSISSLVFCSVCCTNNSLVFISSIFILLSALADYS